MSNIVIARKTEKKLLDEAFQSNESEFIAIYGRRRIGKTYLIKNHYNKKKCLFLYVVGMQHATLEEQLENFVESLSETILEGIPLRTPTSWKEAFKTLNDLIKERLKKEKVVVFLDELPWMATHKSKLLTALSYFWNRYWVDCPNLKLVICGSSSSWVVKKIIKARGGLHNRVTRKIKLEPFTLKETREYLRHLNIRLNNKQILELYMTFGGVAHYLKQIKPGLSITQNINRLCFDKNGVLFDEFETLFAALFDESDAFVELIRLIASKHEGISRTDLRDAVKLTASGGTLSTRLMQLEQTGFILSFIPMGNKSKGLYYKIIDEYSLFYLTWIDPVVNTLLKIETSPQYWKGLYKTPKWYTWRGYAFEALCYKHLREIRMALDIPIDALASTWKFVPKKGSSEQGAQIDLLFERKDDAITLGEMKCTDAPYVLDKQQADILMRKITVFRKTTGIDKQIITAFISANGIKKTLYSEELIASVITADDLFRD